MIQPGDPRSAASRGHSIDKSVAHARLRRNQAQRFRVSFDLLAQVPDVDAHCLDVGRFGAAPSCVQQVPVCQHFPAMSEKFAQKVILEQGQPGASAVCADQSLDEIKAEPPVIIDALRPVHGEAIAQRGTYAGHELAEVVSR
jgi:hypothetical protein